MQPATQTPAAAFRDHLVAFMGRRGLDDSRAAALLGVPVFTLKKWAAGTRAPNAAAVRLLDVFCTLEALAPGLLDSFLPEAPARKRKQG
jgi:hypothetical protein